VNPSTNSTVSIGGKVGEWVQGVDKTGAPVIYSLTVTRSPFNARALVERSDALSVLVDRETLEDHSKTRRAILELAGAYGFAHDCNYRIVIRGSPPRGKGLGSSSVDIASALLGLREERALSVSKTGLYKIMCTVERSDYLFDPQSIVAANPLDGTHAIVTRAPNCSILAWDTEPEKSVKTEAVTHLDSCRKPYQGEYSDIFTMIATGDISLILRAATRSAELNDRLLPKIGFDTERKLVKELRDIGLVAAHTGTWLGFVLPRPIDEDAFWRISEFFSGCIKREPTRFETGETPEKT
jgi:uncharacterized protein involved in propanediol utilization